MTETRLNLTKEGEQAYLAYPPQWKYVIQYVLNCKFEGYKEIGKAINQSQSEDNQERNQACGWLGDFFAIYMDQIERQRIQTQMQNMMSSIKKKEKEKRSSYNTHKHNAYSKRSNKESKRNSQAITPKAKGMGE